jgi:hypothetical protein
MKKVALAVSSLVLVAVLSVSLLLFASGSGSGYEIDEYHDYPPLNIYALWDWFYSNDANVATYWPVFITFDDWRDDWPWHLNYFVELRNRALEYPFTADDARTTFNIPPMFDTFSTFKPFSCGEMLSPEMKRSAISRLYDSIRAFHGDEAVIEMPRFNSRFDESIVWDWDGFYAYLRINKPHVFQHMYKTGSEGTWQFSDTPPPRSSLLRPNHAYPYMYRLCEEGIWHFINLREKSMTSYDVMQNVHKLANKGIFQFRDTRKP